jgi:hypothetical protein
MSVAANNNKPSRQKLVMLGGASVVALAVGIRMMSSGPESAPAATVGTPTDGSVVATVTSTAGPKALPTIEWPTHVARDPFASELVFPPSAPTPPPPPVVDPATIAPIPPPVDLAALVREKIHLKGTILGERPIAMMNGRVYRVGEVLEGFKVVEIEKKQITVERDGTRLVVEVQ